MNYLILLPKVKQPRNQQTEMTSLEDPNGQAQATYFQESVSTTGNSTPTVTQSNDPQHHHHHQQQQQQQQHHHHHVGSYYQDSPSSTYTYEVDRKSVV